MLGRFLEVSVSCPDVLESIHAFEALGFREIPVGDVWSHPYAVVSDGRLNIGLHRYDFDSPSLTFVQSDLQKWRDAYRVQGIELAFEKLSSESFNEVGFVAPGGQMTAVLESRTFSPAPFEERDISILGQFASLEIPTNDEDENREFWRKLGLEEDDCLGTSGLHLLFGSATSLVCHFRCDILELAQAAARRGIVDLTIAADEQSARITIDGLTLTASAPVE
jgi:hypothetical protein